MITGGIFTMFGSLMDALALAIPDGMRVPGYFSLAFEAVFSLLQNAMTLSVWVPIPFVLAAISFRFFVVLAGGAVKAGRVVISLFTGGGGSAA